MRFTPKINTSGERSKPAIPILKVGILDRIGSNILVKALSRIIFSCPIGCSGETCTQLNIIQANNAYEKNLKNRINKLHIYSV